jgi:hypothetical protein
MIELLPLMTGHFAWEIEDTFLYFAVKSAFAKRLPCRVATLSQNFRLEIVAFFL